MTAQTPLTEGAQAGATVGLDGWTLRETAHVNGGKEWFGYKYQCIQQPRIGRIDRYIRKDRSVVSTWRLDGEDCGSLGEAIEGLEYPPTMTFAELDAVAQFQTEEMGKRDFADFDAVRDALYAMALKGLVWWKDGRVRLLPDALTPAIGSAESNASGNPSYDAVALRVAAARAAIAKATGGAA